MTSRAAPFAVGLNGQALKRRSIQGAAFTFVAQAAKFGLQFGSMVVLTRFLEPADFGLIALESPVRPLADRDSIKVGDRLWKV